MSRPEGDRSSPSLFELVGIGMTSVVCICLGTGVGYWIASSTGAGAGVILAGLVVGISAAVGAAYVRIKRYS